MDFFVLCNLLVCRFFIGRVFPAPAGMTRARLPVKPMASSVPRTRGDDPLEDSRDIYEMVCSPHPRG